MELRFVNSMHFRKVLLATVGLISLYVPVATLYFGARYLGLDDGLVHNSADESIMESLPVSVFVQSVSCQWICICQN